MATLSPLLHVDEYPNNSFVLRKQKLTYVEVTKAACTSLRWMIADIAGEDFERFYSAPAPHQSRLMTIHTNRRAWKYAVTLGQLDAEERAEVSPHNDWLIFAVVRDPWTRLWSAWQSKFLFRHIYYLRQYGAEPWFPRLPEKASDVLDDWYAFVDSAPWNSNPELARDPHFLPQLASVRPDEVDYSRIYDLADLPALIRDVRAHLSRLRMPKEGFYLPRANENPLPLPAAAFDNGVAESIRRLYAADFDNFGDRWDFAGLELSRGPLFPDILRTIAYQADANERIADLSDMLKTSRRSLATARRDLATAKSRTEEADRQRAEADKRAERARTRAQNATRRAEQAEAQASVTLSGRLRRLVGRLRRRLNVPRTVRRAGSASNEEGGAGTAPVRRFLARAPHRDQLTRPGARLVLLAGTAAGEQATAAGVARWVSQLPAGSVTVLGAAQALAWRLTENGAQFVPAETVRERDDYLKRHGPVEAIVDLERAPLGDHQNVWRALFYHLVPGGVYAFDARLGGVSAKGPGCAAWIDQLIAMREAPNQLRTAAERELGRALGKIRAFPRLVMIENRLRHQLKLRDSEANEVLSSREPGLAVAVERSLPAGAFDFPGAIVTHPASVEIPSLPSRFQYPPLNLRRYTGSVTLVSNSLLHTRDTVLPDSFRHHLQRELINPRLLKSSSDFGRVQARFAARRALPGSYFDLDSENSGHFGHLMTEVVSRLWGWDEAKTRDPELKAIMRIRFPEERDPALERRIFQAYGIRPDDLVVIDEPVTLESVVAATPMWHNHVPHYVHPDITAIWRRITDSIADPSIPAQSKLFVSRQSHQNNRNCRNAASVEERFAAAGFAVVYPELCDLAQQAGLFANARVVAGFGGSGMFNMLHCRRLQTMIVLSHEAYTARNEHLFAAALGADVHYFWSTPDISHPPGGWRKEAFYSDWEFDFGRNAADLDELLTMC